MQKNAFRTVRLPFFSLFLMYLLLYHNDEGIYYFIIIKKIFII